MRRPTSTAGRTAALLGAVLVPGACAATKATSHTSGLARYPEAEHLILAYYASQGSGEPRFNCGRGTIEWIDGSRIVTDTPAEVIFEVTYRFSASNLAGSDTACDGTNTRYFTFDRVADGRLTLAEMADEAPWAR
jgi:hypothetical protein